MNSGCCAIDKTMESCIAGSLELYGKCKNMMGV